MSKSKHRDREQTSQPVAGGLVAASEYSVIFSDLVRVILLNVLYLALILVLYHYNTKTGFLEHYAARLFHW